MRVAPHVKLLRRAVDVDRDRLERELRFVRRLRGGGLVGLGRLGGVICGDRGVELRLRVNDAASCAAVAAPFFASSAVLAASAASRASGSARTAATARAFACGTNNARWENSTGAASSGEMITRIPIRVLSNSFSAKS
jgi:hypothetical protein